MEKKGKGKQYHLPFNIMAVGKGEGDENFGKENKDFKNLEWVRIPSDRELYTSL